MSTAAERAIRDWVNARPIIGDGKPLARGAYLLEQASPADGAYAVISRNPEGDDPVGPPPEDGQVSVARIQAQVFAGAQDAAENAAAALRGEFETLTGRPQSCGATGVQILVADHINGPFYVPGTREPYCFQVGADFLLTG